MHNHRLKEVLDGICEDVAGEIGRWNIKYRGYQLMVITDPSNNRMRIICPILEEKKVKSKQLNEAMGPNFDRALDVKYALYEGYMWSVFAHPFKELTGDLVYNAVDQVYWAARTFGTTYTSSSLVFGGGSEPER